MAWLAFFLLAIAFVVSGFMTRNWLMFVAAALFLWVGIASLVGA